MGGVWAAVVQRSGESVKRGKVREKLQLTCAAATFNSMSRPSIVLTCGQLCQGMRQGL
jgi:hypothetical protein